MSTTQTTEAHSPLPWKLLAVYKHVALEGDLDGWRLTALNTGGIESPVAYIKRHNGNFDGPTQEANAEIIVAAVNSHARLLADREKLRKALGYLDAAGFNLENSGGWNMPFKSKTARGREASSGRQWLQLCGLIASLKYARKALKETD